ncbi:MAG TPA: hypothetical protein VFM46_00555, partial [Pseudomonadales bacterium]|nr:hypothetical protein [Pseudomonadales bacterium]
TGHAQSSSPLTAQQKQAIADFELSLNSAQIFSSSAQWLNVVSGKGGAINLAAQPFYVGINDNFGDSVTNAEFDNKSITLYDGWEDKKGSKVDDARAAIARGEEIFYSKKITISGVAGINDDAAFGYQDVIEGTCTTCHNTPNVGSHSVMRLMNIGISDAQNRTADLPLYTLKNKDTGEEVKTSDPGRALISGHWADIGRFKPPVLRNLAARPPYFHNGSAATMADVVNYYNDRFNIDLTDQEKRDLVAFLNAL